LIEVTTVTTLTLNNLIFLDKLIQLSGNRLGVIKEYVALNNKNTSLIITDMVKQTVMSSCAYTLIPSSSFDTALISGHNKSAKCSSFSIATLRHIILKRVRFTFRDSHACTTPSVTAIQAATSGKTGECELTNFTISCICFGVHPSALPQYMAFHLPAKAGANLYTQNG